MSELGDLIKELNISQEQLLELANAVRANPLAAFGVVQRLGLNPQALQRMARIIVSNPASLRELAAENGWDADAIDHLKSKLGVLGLFGPK